MPSFRIDSFIALTVADLSSVAEGVPFIFKNELHVYSKAGKHTLLVRLTGDNAPVASEYRLRGNSKVAVFREKMTIDAMQKGSLIAVSDSTPLKGCLLVTESGDFCICADLPYGNEPTEPARLGYLPVKGTCEFHERSRLAVTDRWQMEWRDSDNKIVLTLANGVALSTEGHDVVPSD